MFSVTAASSTRHVLPGFVIKIQDKGYMHI